jgi:predicted dehydrogenase
VTSLRVGIIGCGSFAQSFIRLFQLHPWVDDVVLCDLDPEKLAENAARWEASATIASLDEVCADPSIDAVALFTQNWMHAPQAMQALAAGKHVYSAVPTGIEVDEIRDLVKAVETSGLVYMIGETSYYYPAVLYCRRRFHAGDFGRPVYGEAEYIHDFDHGLYDVYRSRGGDNWRDVAGAPPMHYPTHSTSEVLSVTGAHMTHVSCQGFVDEHEDGLFRAGVNRWDNTFSNQSALFRLSDGSSCRINEFRRVGHPGAVRFSLFGTEGSFEQHVAGSSWLSRDREATQSLDEALACTGVPIPAHEADGMGKVTASDGTHEGMSSQHPVHRLPLSYAEVKSGHAGSHAFLIDDFVRAVAHGDLPPNHAWDAARYAIPGLIAHESSCLEGQLLQIPDLGGPGRSPVVYEERP